MSSWVEIASIPPASPVPAKGNLIILIGFDSSLASEAIRYLDKSKYTLYDMSRFGIHRLSAILKTRDNLVTIDTCLSIESRQILINTALDLDYKVALVIYVGPHKFYGGSASISTEELESYGSKVFDYVITTPKMINYTMKTICLVHLA